LCLDLGRDFSFSLLGLPSEVVQESRHPSHISSEHASLLWLWQYDKREISSLCAVQTSSSVNQALPCRNLSNLEQSIHGDRSLHMRANAVAMYDSTAVATSIMIRQHSLMAWRSTGQNCREKFRGLARACAAMESSTTRPQFACRLLQNFNFPTKFPSVRPKDTKITTHCWWGTSSVRILVTHSNLWIQNMKSSPMRQEGCNYPYFTNAEEAAITRLFWISCQCSYKQIARTQCFHQWMPRWQILSSLQNSGINVTFRVSHSHQIVQIRRGVHFGTYQRCRSSIKKLRSSNHRFCKIRHITRAIQGNQTKRSTRRVGGKPREIGEKMFLVAKRRQNGSPLSRCRIGRREREGGGGGNRCPPSPPKTPHFSL
jgi:hypothetical protein